MTGLVLIVAACWGTGLLWSTRLSQRVHALEGCISFVGMLKDQLRYTMAPMDRVMGEIGRRLEFASLDFVHGCNQSCETGLPFPKAFREALGGHHGPLVQDDLAALLPLSETLGSVDLDGQLSALALCNGILEDRLRAAREQQKTHSRLYSTLGLLVGIAAAIIVI